MFRVILSPSLPLVFFGLILVLLSILIFLYPKLLAYFVAIFLLLQGFLFIFLGMIFRASRQRKPMGYYREVEIEE